MDVLEIVRGAAEVAHGDAEATDHYTYAEATDHYTYLVMHLFNINPGKEAVRLYMIIAGIRGMPESVSDFWHELHKP